MMAPSIGARLGRARTRYAAALLAAAAGIVALPLLYGRAPQAITVDYPLEGSVFPPDFAPPTVEWRDADTRARAWTIEVGLGDGRAPFVRTASRGEPPRIGEIDPRAVGPTNELPTLAPERAAAHTWAPDSAVWDAIKRGAAGRTAVLTITGHGGVPRRAVSRGQVTIAISRDPVGAPILYRDVPLRPSAGERGVIQPLDRKLMPLIAWRLRNLAEPTSRVVMEGLHSCTNCHSFSRDGKTMGLDLDGPRNDKGLYALFPLRPRSAIRKENVIEWSTYRGKLGGKLRAAFMSQLSPDGRYVVTTINDPGAGQTDYQRRQAPQDLWSNYYVANFEDYRFLQVFYLTRGILAWYSRETGLLQPLPGADDPRFVHTNAVWSPDGSFLVFARAEAKDAYPPGSRPARRANDPAETQIQYDLYRIPFNGGRGGRAEPIAGASSNGMSNSFPKVSPDGRWIVFVQARNGQLMRPDGRLYVVPVRGGEARLLRANTPLMNSWHSFSPNGRWLVFSSKSRSPYTQMLLTHFDEQGNDTPAILIENSTAANRAVNLPEFVNLPPDGRLEIDAPVAEYFRLIDLASTAMNEGRHREAIPLLQAALESNPGDARVHNSFGSALAARGRLDEAIAQYRTATRLSPDYPDAHHNLALALAERGRTGEAIVEFRKSLALKPGFAEAHAGLGGALAQAGAIGEAIPHLLAAVRQIPDDGPALVNLCLALAKAGRLQEAIPYAERAVTLSGGQNPLVLGLLGRLYARTGRLPEAIASARQALGVAVEANDTALAGELRAELLSYEAAISPRPAPE